MLSVIGQTLGVSAKSCKFSKEYQSNSFCYPKCQGLLHFHEERTGLGFLKVLYERIHGKSQAALKKLYATIRDTRKVDLKFPVGLRARLIN